MMLHFHTLDIFRHQKYIPITDSPLPTQFRKFSDTRSLPYLVKVQPLQSLFWDQNNHSMSVRPLSNYSLRNYDIISYIQHVEQEIKGKNVISVKDFCNKMK